VGARRSRLLPTKSMFPWHFDGVAVRFSADGDVVTTFLCYGRFLSADMAWHGRAGGVCLASALFFLFLPLIAEAFDCFEVCGIPRHLP
jgi:hypothetical protein